VHPGVTAYLTMPWVNGSTSSWDWNCSGATEINEPNGALAACLDVNGNKATDCSKCTYSFVDVTTADCGMARCNLNGPYTVSCH
jgi:hypothetical protein